MTDPGLTDLIAADLAKHRFIPDEGDDEFGNCSCLTWRGPNHDRHVALVVEQHTKAIVQPVYDEQQAEIEKSRQEMRAAHAATLRARDRAEKAEAAISRVDEIRCGNCNNPLSEGSGNCVSDAGRPHIYDEADLRAALEGEQQ